MQETADFEFRTGPDDDAIYAALATLPPRPVPADLAPAFRSRLVRERTQLLIRHPLVIIAVAASLVLAVGIGWLHERQLRLDDARQMESQLASALQSLSTGVRLQAIEATVRGGRRGGAVESALITALLSDPNTSVRMAAAEALGRIARRDVLGQTVRRALAAERSPFVQMTLLTAAGNLPLAERRAAISPLLFRQDVESIVLNDARDRVREPAEGGSR